MYKIIYDSANKNHKRYTSSPRSPLRSPRLRVSIWPFDTIFQTDCKKVRFHELFCKTGKTKGGIEGVRRGAFWLGVIVGSPPNHPLVSILPAPPDPFQKIRFLFAACFSIKKSWQEGPEGYLRRRWTIRRLEKLSARQLKVLLTELHLSLCCSAARTQKSPPRSSRQTDCPTSQPTPRNDTPKLFSISINFDFVLTDERDLRRCSSHPVPQFQRDKHRQRHGISRGGGSGRARRRIIQALRFRDRHPDRVYHQLEYLTCHDCDCQRVVSERGHFLKHRRKHVPQRDPICWQWRRRR